MSFAFSMGDIRDEARRPPCGTGISAPSTHRPERAETYSRVSKVIRGDRGRPRVMVSPLRCTADRERRRDIQLALIRASMAGRGDGKPHHEDLKPRAVVVVDGDLNFVEQRMHPLPLHRAQLLLRRPPKSAEVKFANIVLIAPPFVES
jgi:hypothetical protein